MIDHVSIAVSDLARSGAFYDAVLGTIGLERLVTRAATLGYGKRYPEFWLNARPEMAAIAAGTGAHVCLRASDRPAIEDFHATALRLGGRDAGPPGDRQAAMTTYFGAFILDPDGNKIEAVTFPRP